MKDVLKHACAWQAMCNEILEEVGAHSHETRETERETGDTGETRRDTGETGGGQETEEMRRETGRDTGRDTGRETGETRRETGRETRRDTGETGRDTGDGTRERGKGQSVLARKHEMTVRLLRRPPGKPA